MRIVLVRHGETEWSASGRHTSYTDVELTEAGRKAAKALGARLAGQEFALVLTSPLRRARDTCDLAGYGGQAQIEDNLVEWNYGTYEGLTTPQIRESRPGWSVWDCDSPGGETPVQVGARADRVLARVAQVDGDVLLFAHGHFLRILGARWIGLEPTAGGNLGLGTAALCELGFERERHVVWLWNDTSHLPS